MEDTRNDCAEPRFQALGVLEEHPRMLVFAPRGATVYVISLRRANRRERTSHVAQTEPELIDDEAPEAKAEWFNRARLGKDVQPGLVGRRAATALLKPTLGDRRWRT